MSKYRQLQSINYHISAVKLKKNDQNRIELHNICVNQSNNNTKQHSIELTPEEVIMLFDRLSKMK